MKHFIRLSYQRSEPGQIIFGMEMYVGKKWVKFGRGTAANILWNVMERLMNGVSK